MTDAERWRRIARATEQERPGTHYLCWQFAPEHRRGLVGHRVPQKQGARMCQALYETFTENPVLQRQAGTVIFSYDNDRRVWAACLLAAMADADGGNHKSERGLE